MLTHDYDRSNPVISTDEPWQDLANAIVVRAIDDYRLAMRGLWTEDTRSDAEVMQEVEKFLHSQYYKLLTNVDPDELLKMIHREYKDGLRLIAAGNEIKAVELKKNYRFVCPSCGKNAYVKVTRFRRRKKDGSLVEFRRKWYSCEACHLLEYRYLIGEENNNET